MNPHRHIAKQRESGALGTDITLAGSLRFNMVAQSAGTARHRALRCKDGLFLRLVGGDGGIRTLDTGLAYTHFPGVRLQPLGHVSNYKPVKFDP